MTEYSHTSKGKIIIGLVLILLGLLMTLENFSLFDGRFNHYIFSWQMLLIVIGFIILINDKSSFFGLVLMMIGGISIASEVWDFSFSDFVSDYWPVLLILLGLQILWKREPKVHEDRKHFNPINNSCCDGEKEEVKESNADTIDMFSVFGTGRRIFKSASFKGGKITNLMGGLKIDLLDCKLAEGKQTLDIVTIMAGTEIFVPENWNVKISAVPIFGGFSDKRRVMPKEFDYDGPILNIKGLFIFGGGEIKN
ncbi:MAG: DUF5668 domain-containing protein [bacterium]